MKKKFDLLNFLSIFLLFSFSQSYCEIKAIIWDFGGVLGQTSELKFAKEIGIQNLLKLGLSDILTLDFSNLGLKEKVLEIMCELGTQEKADNGLVSKHGNIEIPKIMCDWFTGTISGSDANNKVQDYLNIINVHEKIKTPAEKEVLSRIIKIMFDEKKLAEFTLPIKESLNILKELKDKNKNYKFLILSNWSAISFDMVYKYSDYDMQDILSYFDPKDIFISGDMKIMKPSSQAYINVLTHVREKYNITPEECLMIDDQPENIEAATKFCNMKGLLVNKDCSNLRAELVKLNLLAPKSSMLSSLMPFSWS